MALNPHQVRSRLVSHATTWIDYPQAYDGIAASSDVRDAQEAKTPWVRCTIATGDSFIACLGARPESRHTGVVLLQVFTKAPAKVTATNPPEGILASQIASSLSDHWEYRALGGVETLTPSLQTIGPLDGYYQINVSVPYRT